MAQTKAQLLGPVVGDVVMDVSTLSLDAEGNKVGIGHSEPDLTLHVSGVDGLPSSSGSTATGHLTLRDKANSTKGMFLGVSDASPFGSWIQAQDSANNATNYPLLLNPNGGNIGINQTNPTRKLHITTASGSDTAGSTDSHLFFDVADDSGPGWVQRVYDSGAGSGGQDGSFALDRYYSNQWINTVTIKRDTGNVGIGTVSPEYKTTIAADGANAKLNIKRKTAAASNGNAFGSLFYTNSDGTDVASIRAHRESANDDAYLGFATRNTGGSITEKLRINSDGNIGVNKTTPKEWYSDYRTIQIYDAGYIAGSSDDSFVAIGANNYLDTDETYDYANTDHASQLYQVDGQLVFRNAPSGTADTAITWTERFKVTSAGDVGIGDTAPNTSYGTNLSVHSTTTDGARIKISDGTSGKGNIDGLDIIHQSGIAYFIQRENNDMRFFTNSTEKLRITSAGHVRVNTGDLRVGDDTDSNAGSQTISVGSVSSGSGGIGIFANPTNGNSWVQFGDGTSGSDQYRGYMNYRHADDSLRFGTAGTDRLLISNAGFVGLNGQTNPEYPFDLIDGNNRAYFTQGSDSTMSLVLYDNSSHRTSIQAHGGQLRLNVTPTAGGSLEPCMKFNTDGDAIIGQGFNDDPTSNRRLIIKDTNAIVRIESPGSASGEYAQLEFRTGSTSSAWIWRNPSSNSNYGGASSFNFYQGENADIAFLTNGNNVRFKIRGDGNLQVGPNGNNFVKNEYAGTASVTGTNTESFAFEFQGTSYGGGGHLFFWGTSGNVVVNVSAEILVNHSQDVTIKSMSGAYTQGRIRIKTDSNARAAVYIGRSGGYASGTTSLNWRFIPYGGTYAYTTESTNTGTDHTHSTSSGSFNLTAAGGGAANVNAAGSKNFLINHPLESLGETTRLVHAALEGPECNTIYRGKVDLVDGTATVNIDTNSRMTEGTFVALNQNVQCFTTNETGWTAIKGSVSGNLLTITAQDNTCTDTISWMVVGERKDQDIIDNRATDSEGRLITEITNEYDASQFAAYTNPVEPEPEPNNTEERDPTV